MSGVRDLGGAPPADTSSQPNLAPPDAPHVSVPAAEPDFESQFGDLFRHDPFAKNAGEPQEPVAPVVQVQAPVVQAPPVAPGPSIQADPNSQAPVVADPNATIMRDTAAALAAATQNLNQRPQGSTPPAEDPALNYFYDVPQQLATELTHEDPGRRVKAMSYIQGAMAREVHTRMRTEMQRYISTDLPSMIHSMIQANNFRETLQRDFYGTYPQLQSPHLAPTVKHFTNEILQAERAVNPSLTWSPQLRDKIATAIFTAIPGLRAPAGPAPANPPAPNTPQPPRLLTNGTRPATPSARQDIATDIMDTLFSN